MLAVAGASVLLYRPPEGSIRLLTACTPAPGPLQVWRWDQQSRFGSR